uniref:VWFA domain-containing protein n=1 Tax=Heliothis virescens TaxID=7102 RepID=A0A2A4K3Q3_HELVI
MYQINTNMYWLPVFLVAMLGGAHAQQTAQTRVADTLSECYRNPLLMNRNNLPPVTVPVLIDIIRKIEDNPNVNMDLRQLSAVLLHTYRQDGIEFHQPENSITSSNVLPFAPTFHSFHRHRLLLTRLIPNNLQVLSNDTISMELTCTLHHMLSTTVDARVRGDENTCSQLSQYRYFRSARTRRSISEDVEILKPADLKSANKNGKMRRYDPNNDVEFSNVGNGGSLSERQVAESTCPLLGGVIKTAWGAVSAGNLIAGIAAGAQPQRVNILDLVRDASNVNYRNVQQTVTSLYPATLAGDLAEAVLIQGTERGSTSISVGTGGNWNSTQAPRHFMLTSRNNVEMTDPEIRGDIDGFVLGSTITGLLSTFSSLKLSQLLDMYYSQRNGAFDSNLRACNRRALMQQYVTNDNLVSETHAFAAALDTNMPLRGTIIGGLDQLVTSAVTNLQNYINTLTDMDCATTSTQSNDFRLRTNLYIALDSSWSFQLIAPAISYLVDSIEVGKYGSSVTLLSAFDGSVIVNTTYSPADFYAAYNATTHASIIAGVNLETSLTNIKLLLQQTALNESLRNYVGGNSSVLVYLTNTGNLQTTNLAWEQAREINNTLPDVRVLYVSATNQFDTLWSYARDMYNDIFTVALNTAGTDLDNSMGPVLRRIQSVGRRIVNPTCGFIFEGGSSGTRQFDDFVEPGYINFYSLSANYFFEHNDNRKVRVSRSGTGLGALIVCYSRTVVQPRRNSTTSTSTDDESAAVTCQTLNTGNVEIVLQNACSGWWYINECSPLYISVQSDTGVAAGSYVSATCTDANCRFPYNIRYQIQIEELGCFSGASSITASFLVLLSALYLTLYSS